ncbi:MAG TPA: class I tRNA ligase family protein, partial [bacterium]|nr:class I tRNA ligase family protein [bacterium]
YFGGVIPEAKTLGLELPGKAQSDQTRQYMDKLAFDVALEDYWKLVKTANKYIQDSAPWNLAKDESKKEELQKVIYTMVEVLRVTALRLSPFMPFTAQAIWQQLGFADKVETHAFSETESAGVYQKGQKVQVGTPLFPRIEIKKEAAGVSDDALVTKAQNALKKNISQQVQKALNSKPDCGWLATSGKEYQELLAAGKYGFYVRSADKKRHIIEIEKQKLLDAKDEAGLNALADHLSKQVQTLLTTQS